MASGGESDVFDLTADLSKYLDRHMVYQILLFLEKSNIYPIEELLNAQLEVLSKTRMVKPEMDVYMRLHKLTSEPEELVKRRDVILKEHESLQEAAKDQQNFEAQFELAKFKYDCGAYPDCILPLKNFAENLSSALPDRDELELKAVWGQLAANILISEWVGATENMKRISELLDKPVFTEDQSNQLVQRAWLAHWGLWVFFNHSEGGELMWSILFEEKFRNTIQIKCRHLLRYFVVYMIVNKRRRSLRKQVLEMIEVLVDEEEYKPRDPVVETVRLLFLEFDFEAALGALKRARKSLACDFFVNDLAEQFVQSARELIFEIFFRIHSRIDMGYLAQQLEMSADDAEMWIVNLVRTAKISAKVDSKNNTLIISPPELSVYKGVLDKTRAGTLKTAVIADALDQLKSDQFRNDT